MAGLVLVAGDVGGGRDVAAVVAPVAATLKLAHPIAVVGATLGRHWRAEGGAEPLAARRLAREKPGVPALPPPAPLARPLGAATARFRPSLIFCFFSAVSFLPSR